jgi:predicted transcriptional regulator
MRDQKFNKCVMKLFKGITFCALRNGKINMKDLYLDVIAHFLVNYYSRKEISELIGISDRTITRCARILLAKGWIKFNKDWKRGHNPKYRYPSFLEINNISNKIKITTI